MTTTPPPATPVEDARVTVVVASRNRREELLASLPRHRAPVVLVDNASQDGSAAAVRRAHPWVDVVALDRNVGAHARTIGAARARTPYVAFADDDSWWAPGSLARAAEVLDRYPQVGLVTATVLLGPDQRVDPLSRVLAGSPLDATGLPGARVLGFAACAAVVRRDVFTAVGGFDDVVRFPGEEERVALDLTAAGRPLVHLDDLVVHHHPSPHRHAPAVRAQGITRSTILTALLRLPWAEVARRSAAALREGAPARAGLLEAVSRAPAALRRRRPVPPHVVADLRNLREAPTEVPVPAHPMGGERR